MYVNTVTCYGHKRNVISCLRSSAPDGALKIYAVLGLMLSCIVTRLCLQQGKSMSAGRKKKRMHTQNKEILIF